MKVFQFLLASALVFLSCTSNDEFEPIEMNASTTRIVNNSNKFSMNIFRSMNAEKTGENMVCSPLSISSLLSVILNGADGETAQELNNALGTSGMGLQEVNESYRQLQNDLKNVDKSTKLNLANSIWSNQVELKKDFVRTSQKYYGAQIQTLDFSNPKSFSTIDSWANKNTNGLIPKLPSLSKNSKLILVNALYFEGKWAEKYFKEDKTSMQEFRNSDQTKSLVKTMVTSDTLMHYYSDDMKISRLSYGNGAYEFIIAMPEHGTIDDCMDFLNQHGGLEALHDLATVKHPITIYIPKFDISSHFDLIKHCQALGIESLFDRMKSDVPFMAEENLFVTKAEHLVKFTMDEQGAKAAAISIAELMETSKGKDPIRLYDPIHYDKPFLFCIMETSTKTVLFLGKIEKL